MFWSHCHEQLNSTNCSYSSNSCIQCSFVVLDPSNSCNSSTTYHSHCDRPHGPLPSLHAAWLGAQASWKQTRTTSATTNWRLNGYELRKTNKPQNIFKPISTSFSYISVMLIHLITIATYEASYKLVVLVINFLPKVSYPMHTANVIQVLTEHSIYRHDSHYSWVSISVNKVTH